MVAEFWAAFEAATGVRGPYTTWGFGDDAKPDLMTDRPRAVREGLAVARRSAGLSRGRSFVRPVWPMGRR
jgi:hypothetical protein